MLLTAPSALLSRRRIRRAGLPTPWPEHPVRQLVRWASDMDGLLADVRAGEAGAYTLDLWGHGLVAVFTSEEARRAVIKGSAEDFGHANDLAALFVGPSSLLLLDGEKHAAARRRTMAVIAGDGLMAYGATMASIADAWVDSLDVGSTTEALVGAQWMTLDVILQTVFGMQPGPAYDALHRLAREFMEGGRGTAGNLASMLLPAATVRRLMVGRRAPDMTRLPEPVLLRALGGARGVREARELVDRLMDQVRERRAHLDDGGTDALARILRHASDKGTALGDAELVDELLTLLLGGHETTAVALGWLLYRLAGQPDAWVRARAELDEAFGDGPLDARRAARLPYLSAVVEESLRLDGLTLGVMRRTRTRPHHRRIRDPGGHARERASAARAPRSRALRRASRVSSRAPAGRAPVTAGLRALRRRVPALRRRGLRHLRAEHAGSRDHTARGAARARGAHRGARAVRALPGPQQRHPARGAEPPLSAVLWHREQVLDVRARRPDRRRPRAPTSLIGDRFDDNTLQAESREVRVEGLPVIHGGQTSRTVQAKLADLDSQDAIESASRLRLC
ncbi:MAG: cytochrome P450 [Myxococcales bacterium]|nr:cytochrome P450 [Myxococcales bacterium]